MTFSITLTSMLNSFDRELKSGYSTVSIMSLSTIRMKKDLPAKVLGTSLNTIFKELPLVEF